MPVSGGGWCPCARCPPICSSPFPYSTVAYARALVNSQDALSVFEAAVVEGRAHNWTRRQIGGLDSCMDNLDKDISWVPLTDILDTYLVREAGCGCASVAAVLPSPKLLHQCVATSSSSGVVIPLIRRGGDGSTSPAGAAPLLPSPPSTASPRRESARGGVHQWRIRRGGALRWWIW